MRLNRLELQGFKSFADRTVFNFGGQHLLGIVGPNGCGKSNVVDAVRWVLGETRPTSMRGEGMTDVIFKGSASRAGMSMAEVTLVIDNSEKVIEEIGAEFSITRILYGSGEGEYRIDGEKVRLKDIRELLYGTGLGSRGYSVLEQGRIDAVLSANPAQRRAVFEEAAGISRYRQRRHEAGLRLKRVEQDVARLDDVMGELRTRVRSLKIQAGKAERWVVARDEWTLDRGRFLRHRLYEQDTELAQLFPELQALEEQQATLREERAQAEELVRSQEEQRSRVVAELDALSTQVGQLGGALATLDERKNQLNLRIQSWRVSAQEESERARQLVQQVEDRRAEQSQTEQALGDLEGVAALALEQASGLQERMRTLSRSYKDARAQTAAQNEVVLTKLHERTGAQNQVTHLEAAIVQGDERLERVGTRAAEVSEALEGVRADLARAEHAEQHAHGEFEQRESDWRAARVDLEAAQVDLDSALATLRGQELEHTALATRSETLLEGDDESGGMAAGARRVLQSVASGQGPCSAGVLKGLLADHLKVEVRWARALDSILGEKAQAILAPDSEQARAVLDWLAHGSKGQAGVLVPTGLQQVGGLGDIRLGHLESPSFLAFEPYAACVEGRLSELVRCDDSLRPLVEALLGDVVVTRDRDSALELVQREPRWRYVTTAGERVDAMGAVGGSTEVAQGAMGRRALIQEIEGQMQTLDGELTQSRERVKSLEQSVAACSAACEESGAEREQAQQLLAEARSSLQTAKARLSDQEAVRAEHVLQEGQAQAELQRLRSDLQEAQAGSAACVRAFDAANAELETLEVQRRGLEEERESLAKEEARAQVESTRLAGEMEALRSRVKASEHRCTEDQAECERAEGRSRNFLANADQATEEGCNLEIEGEQIAAQKKELESRLEDLREMERQGAARTREVREQAEQVQRTLDKVGEDQSQRRLRAQRVELSREELLARAQEDLSLQGSDLRDDFVPEDELGTPAAMQALEEHVAALKATLEKIGPVNTEAVDELAEVSERLEFLETQATDLADSRKTLGDTIARIDEESRRLFEDTFKEVRTNFQSIFRMLFGGGQADVILEPGVDVLEAGVEIVARPPGRESLSIGLLSGGQRTMTALALLFAVFKAQPSPFCVLDEVDAALDDANIDRFLGMLASFAESTQFIVVTHNKGTMSACQALYGVTMQVKGVSRFVSVELADVEEFAPGETTGTVRAEDRGSEMDSESHEPVVELIPSIPGGASIADWTDDSTGESAQGSSGEPSIQASSPSE